MRAYIVLLKGEKMDLKSFSKEDIEEVFKDVENGKNFDKTSFDEIQEQYGDKVQDLINKFQSMDEAELLGEIFKIINKQKQDGTFDPQKIRDIAQNIKSFLTVEQQEKLDELLNRFF